MFLISHFVVFPGPSEQHVWVLNVSSFSDTGIAEHWIVNENFHFTCFPVELSRIVLLTSLSLSVQGKGEFTMEYKEHSARGVNVRPNPRTRHEPNTGFFGLGSGLNGFGS